MLRMVTYGDTPTGDPGMNSLLISAEIPPERCVSKVVALRNGTDENMMEQFETANPGQSFPNSRLVPVWPIEQSGYSIVCTYPCDSSRMRLPLNGNHSGDSYLAGYNYTFEGFEQDGSSDWWNGKSSEGLDWLHILRKSNTSCHGNNGYLWDEGIEVYADASSSNRQAYVTVIASPNTNTEEMAIIRQAAEQQGVSICNTVCEKTRILFYQADGSTSRVTYDNINKLTLTATSTTVENMTYTNLATQCSQQDMTSIIFANNTVMGMRDDDPDTVKTLASSVVTSGSKVEIDIAKIRNLINSGYNPGEGGISFMVYGTWQGIGSESRKIPVPIRNSYTVDVFASADGGNSALSGKTSFKSCGNMNIVAADIDSVSTVAEKTISRCATVARINYYSQGTDRVSVDIIQPEEDGICPVFYPNQYSINNQQLADFVWQGVGASKVRTFNAITTPQNATVVVNVQSSNGSTNVPFNVSIGEGSVENSYVISGTTITPGSGVDISSGTFTIDFTGCSQGTHRFRLRQIISDQGVASGNSSPEYADIAFTIT